MFKYLLFRTDRIGDYIFSRILIESIKKKNDKNIIDVVSSKYNHAYIKTFKDNRFVYPFDKYDLKLLLNNFIKINSQKYDYIIILDGKRRSIFYSLLLSAKYKIAVLKDFRPNFLLKFFFNKYFINTELTYQYDNFLSLCNYLDLKIPHNLDYFNNHLIKDDKYKTFTKNSLVLHLDEKWFEGFYHHDYVYMNLNDKNFINFIKCIFKKFKKKIVITTGSKKIDILEKIISKHFKKKTKNIYYSKTYLKKLTLIKKTNFYELESITKNCSILICCEGAISHVSHALKKDTIALVNKQNLKTANYWTNHMPKIKLIYRDSLEKLCIQINNIKL